MKGKTFHSKAIVLSREIFGESDCYVHFFTQQYGLVSTLAKSGRKSRKRFGGGLDLFCHDDITFQGTAKGHSLLLELSVLNAFLGIRDNIIRCLTAGKASSWIKKLVQTGTPSPEIYSILGQTLALIEKEDQEDKLEVLLLIFKLKLLDELGLSPRADSCLKCAETEEESSFFDIEAGGILCRKCLPKESPKLRAMVNPEEKQFLHYVPDFKFSRFADLNLNNTHAHHLIQLTNQFASYHSGVLLT